MSFQLLRSARLPSLNLEFQEYFDQASGAKHYHLASASPESAFMVAFPTVPDTDDGRAHILEHMALCGSERFPTRDPFFAMLRRSLATFMNAMTYPDRTVYPFASQDPTDFMNLMEVYLDAAFFPKLDYFDFRQEGWRLERGADGQLAYHGVVFNEMKGAFASPLRSVWHGLEAAQKAGTTYAQESGGDPLSIPDLTHEQLLAFHAEHYHPSRAVFYSFGSIDPLAVQSKIEQRVLSRITERLPRIETPLATPLSAPVATELRMPATGDGPQHAYQVSWMIGDVSDAAAISEWQLFAEAIHGDSASPMRLALEAAGFGRPSSISGIDSGTRQATFHLGMEGLTPEQVDQARALIHQTLDQIARDGVPFERLEGLARDFELNAREISGSRTPYGLQLLLSMVPLEMAGGDPLAAIDHESDLARIRELIKDPDFIKSKARHLLASQAKVEATVVPDPDFFPARERAEAARLARESETLTEADLARLDAEAAALKEKQREAADASCLPMIDPASISRELPVSPSVRFERSASGPSVSMIEAPTNGVAYLRLQLDASDVPEADWPYLNLLANLIPQLGLGSMNFEQAEIWRAQLASSFHSSVSVSTPVGNPSNQMALRLTLNAKSLDRDALGLAEALSESALHARFDERDRIAYLIQSSLANTLQHLGEAGPSFASTAATSPFGALGRHSASTSGAQGLAFLRDVEAQTRDPKLLAALCEKLASLHARLLAKPALLDAIGSIEGAQKALQEAQRRLASLTPSAALGAQSAPIASADGPMAAIALAGPGQVNYCYRSWKSPSIGHPDAAKMQVLAAFLRDQFLHRVIREEGGAYGASASQSSGSGCFTLSSYRDPRLAGTYADFDRAIDHVLTAPIEPQALKEAIVSVMQSLDKPSSPRGEAATALAREQSGLTPAQRLANRQAILSCSADDLRRLARQWLKDQPSSRAAFVCPGSIEEAASIGLTVEHLVAPKTSRGPKM